MSAHLVFHAPIGSIIAWSDGTPRPPERHRKKLSAWKNNNSSGRLIRRQEHRAVGNTSLPGDFTLHEADHGAGGVITIRIHRTFSADSTLRFSVLARPTQGSVRVFNREGDGAELVYLATHRADAEEWLSRHGYPNAVLDEVSADEAAADAVEGRVA